MDLYQVFSNVGHVQAELGVIIACVLSWIVASTGIASPPQRSRHRQTWTETIVRVIASLSIGYAILWFALWNAAQVDARPGYAVALGALAIARAVFMLMA
jgi:hypothetical protein